MASLVENRANTKAGFKTYHVLRLTVYGKTVSKSLGPKLNKKAGAEVLRVAQHLEDCHRTGVLVSPDFAAAFDRLGPKLQKKIIATGVYERPHNPSISDFLRDFMADYRTRGMADTSIVKRERTANRLAAFIGPDRPLTTVMVADVKAFKRHLEGQGFAITYVSDQLKHCGQFFGWAVDRELIQRNPFSAIPKPMHSRGLAPLPPETLSASLDGLGETQWACLFAVYRWTGCRKAEALAIQWADIDFDAKTIRIPQSKTEGTNGSHRTVPLFDGLLPHLFALREECPDLNGPLFPNLNVSTIEGCLKRRLKKAGVNPWSCLFQRLRVTRSNEIARIPQRGEHLEAVWIGHSPEVSRKHYGYVGSVDFSNALAV